MPHLSKIAEIVRRTQGDREQWMVVRVPEGRQYVLLETGPGGNACLLSDLLPHIFEEAVIDTSKADQKKLPSLGLKSCTDAASAMAALKTETAETTKLSASFAHRSSSPTCAFKSRRDAPTETETRNNAREKFSHLTPRQSEILKLVLAGQPNKIIAADLGLHQRTVENHRAAIMHKTGAKCLATLVLQAVAAGIHTA